MWTDWWLKICVCVTYDHIYTHTYTYIYSFIYYFSFHDFVISKVFNIHRCGLQKKYIVCLIENARRDTNHFLAWFIPTPFPTSRVLVSLSLSFYQSFGSTACLSHKTFILEQVHLASQNFYDVLVIFVDQMFSSFSMWCHGCCLFNRMYNL